VLKLSTGEEKTEKEKKGEQEETELLLQTSETGAELLKYGLLVKQTSHGFTIGGNTYEVKEILKKNGGKWDGSLKEWCFVGQGSLARIRELVQQES
jgi:hypothetical protein